MRRGHSYRWFAVLFLLFASAEISVDVISPELCCEELSGLVSSGSSFAAARDDVDKISAVDNSTHGESSNPGSTEEECFCCCAHILPSLHFEVAELGVEPLTSSLANTILPIAPPQSAYHPPRLS